MELEGSESVRAYRTTVKCAHHGNLGFDDGTLISGRIRFGGSIPAAISTAREGGRIRHGAVPGNAAGKPRCTRQRYTDYLLVDTLQHMTQTLSQAHDDFAIRGEAKMPAPDDAGMHEADWDLMQRGPSAAQNG